jgi:hypothetical protein
MSYSLKTKRRMNSQPYWSTRPEPCRKFNKTQYDLTSCPLCLCGE